MIVPVLSSEQRLFVLKQQCVDLVNIVDTVLKTVRDNQIKPVALRKGDSRAGEQTEQFRHRELQRCRNRDRCFLGRLIILFAPYAGKNLSVDVRLFVYGHIIHTAGIDQPEQPLLEGFAAESLNVPLSGSFP